MKQKTKTRRNVIGIASYNTPCVHFGFQRRHVTKSVNPAHYSDGKYNVELAPAPIGKRPGVIRQDNSRLYAYAGLDTKSVPGKIIVRKPQNHDNDLWIFFIRTSRSFDPGVKFSHGRIMVTGSHHPKLDTDYNLAEFPYIRKVLHPNGQYVGQDSLLVLSKLEINMRIEVTMAAVYSTRPQIITITSNAHQQLFWHNSFTEKKLLVQDPERYTG